VGIANGVFGENADSRGTVLPAAMTIRRDGHRVDLDRDSLASAFPEATGRVVVFLHGLVETERCWFHRSAPEKARTGTDFGSRLADDLSYTPVYLRYNTGRHVSDNGGELADLLADLVEHWPVPVTDVVLVGHSMGGLVARSAVLHAHEHDSRLLPAVSRVVCLGTPHTGAQLERTVVRVGDLLQKFPVTAPLTRVLSLRSDGIKDLGRGRVHHSQWTDTGTDSTRASAPPFPSGVRQYFVAVTLARTPTSLWGRLIGDLLVSPASAGDHTQTAELAWLSGLHHFDLLSHDTVYDTMLDWLQSCSPRTRAPGSR
jgi:pimeloyl-ACP methyl ester carboxylesterase